MKLGKQKTCEVKELWDKLEDAEELCDELGATEELRDELGDAVGLCHAEELWDELGNTEELLGTDKLATAEELPSRCVLLDVCQLLVWWPLREEGTLLEAC